MVAKFTGGDQSGVPQFMGIPESSDNDEYEQPSWTWRWRPTVRKRNVPRETDFSDSPDARSSAASGGNFLTEYVKNASTFRLLTQEEEIELAERARKDDRQARQKLILANLRLVLKFARRYRDRGIDFEDLVQEGNLGLIRAAQLYDPTKGTRFSTYACIWIIQFISRLVDNRSRSVRLPVRVHKDIRKVGRIIQQVKTARGTEPSLSEIVEISKLSESRVQAAFSNMAGALSLDQEVGVGQNREIGDQIVYDDGISSESEAENHLSEALVKQLIKTLNPEELEIVQLRYGLTGTEEIGFKEMSDRSGLSLSKVKRIHSNALKKMRIEADRMTRYAKQNNNRKGRFALPG